MNIDRRNLLLPTLAIAVFGVIPALAASADEDAVAKSVEAFRAAGIAVALQNVILSIAGYFFLIGRFGIKAGDRVQIGGVTGDVIDIGLVKLSLMELGGTGTYREPTGRVAVFSNAIVFQPSGNFFKQAPGTNAARVAAGKPTIATNQINREEGITQFSWLLAAGCWLLSSSYRNGDTLQNFSDSLRRRHSLDLEFRPQNQTMIEYGNRHRLHVIGRNEIAPGESGVSPARGDQTLSGSGSRADQYALMSARAPHQIHDVRGQFVPHRDIGQRAARIPQFTSLQNGVNLATLQTDLRSVSGQHAPGQFEFVRALRRGHRDL